MEFILDNNQAFNILNCKSFRNLLYSLDKNFNIPCDKTIKTMIGRANIWSCAQLKELLKSDCIAAAITTDFWTSRAKQGYIGVTCTWISMDWKPKEALLELKQVPYPHTGEIISQLLKEIFEKWNIEKKIISLTTDNGSNIKKAAKIMNTVDRLPCAAHTLQLTVGKGLNVIKVLILRVKRLIDFFNISPKQAERLNAAQKELNYTNISSVIGDVSTRWNSSFYAWRRLLKLKRAIIFLPSRLQSDLNSDVRKDGQKLQRIILTNDEWKLLGDLVNLLQGFEEVTVLLSGAKYITISLMYPAISRLMSEIKPNNEFLTTEIEGELDENDINIFENFEKTIEENEDLIEIPDEMNKNRNKVDISKPLNFQNKNYLREIKQKMYESMVKYWKTSATIAMVACVLDPRFKKLRFTTEMIKNEVYDDLREIFNEEAEFMKEVILIFF